MILAGDIGGTHTRIALFSQEADRLRLGLEKVYPSREHKSLDEILGIFLRDTGASIDQACFGIAGPVLHGRVSTPNLPWVVDAAALIPLPLLKGTLRSSPRERGWERLACTGMARIAMCFPVRVATRTLPRAMIPKSACCNTCSRNSDA